MCYSEGPYWVGNHEKRERRGRYLPVMRAQVCAVSTGSTGADGSGIRKVQCVCSPTIHPGSFRCRHHHAHYKWVARLGNKPNHLATSVVEAL
ncbi:hypothetical protein RND71_017184 [Anisodus tanguticus]|uniref:Uncharacterized protein n=1 Tax=Anisodus tanguticus TaxID=243964 RepID=A0AAE1V9S7_9SOLA|nr:hypothetical protein RND71_017184 [Anisodus tanguticus]